MQPAVHIISWALYRKGTDIFLTRVQVLVCNSCKQNEDLIAKVQWFFHNQGYLHIAADDLPISLLSLTHMSNWQGRMRREMSKVCTC